MQSCFSLAFYHQTQECLRTRCPMQRGRALCQASEWEGTPDTIGFTLFSSACSFQVYWGPEEGWLPSKVLSESWWPQSRLTCSVREQTCLLVIGGRFTGPGSLNRQARKRPLSSWENQQEAGHMCRLTVGFILIHTFSLFPLQDILNCFPSPPHTSRN